MLGIGCMHQYHTIQFSIEGGVEAKIKHRKYLVQSAGIITKWQNIQWDAMRPDWGILLCSNKIMIPGLAFYFNEMPSCFPFSIQSYPKQLTSTH